MSVCSACGRESPDGFAFCPACGTALAPPAVPREVRKTVTIVFCDLAGSTSLGEKLDPESLRKVMSRYFAETKTVLESHGGTVEKFIGDAVMAVFGIPQVHEDDALRAVRAASEMQEALTALNKELERDRGVAISARIGVNTGEVVAGDPTAGQALVTGDAVNVAARLEQAAAPGEVLIGEATYRLVRDAVDIEPVAPLECKGKAEPVPAYRLIRVVPGAAAHARRMDSPMVGREREAAALDQAFERAISNRACQLFSILAPAGAGKTRLVEEFVAKAVGASILRGRCLAYGEGITYFPVIEVVKEAAGLSDFDPPELVESKIASILEGEEHEDVICGRIAQLMGASEVAAPQETFWAIRRMLEAIARRRPLVLAFDDVHWAEPTFLDLIEHIADWSRDAPILLVCMARPELLDARPTWGGGKLNATTILLEPLTEEECDRLIENLLGTSELPAGFRDRVSEAAEGNPLFVEEMLSMLIDDGRLVRTDGYWSPLTDLSDVTVPPTITALLAARLDQLSTPERQVLEAAAVVGKEFYAGAVYELVPEDLRAQASAHLMSLVRKELIRPVRSMLPGEDAFRFRNLLVRDAAYEAMPKELRAELHERFAGWLEGVAGERIGEQEEILGYHLEQACRLRSELGPADERTQALARAAAGRLGVAGQRAAVRGDAAASNLLGRAVELLPAEDPERRRLLPDLIQAVEDGADLERWLALCEEAIRIGRATGDRVLEQWGLLERSRYFLLADPRGTTLEELSATTIGVVRVFEELGEEAGLVGALLAHANVLWSEGSVFAMLDAAERALELSFRCRPAYISDAVHDVAMAMHLGPTRVSQALAWTREIAERSADRPLVEAAALIWSSNFLVMLGRHDEAVPLLARGRKTFDDLGAPWWIAMVEAAAWFQTSWAGDLATAEERGRAGVQRWRDMGISTNVAGNGSYLAHVQYELGHFDDCYRTAEEAEELAGRWDIEPCLEARAARAKVLARRGELGEAEDLILGTERTVRGTEFFVLTADVLMAKAEVLRLAGRTDEAAPAAREALDMYERKEFVPMVAKARTFLEDLAR